MAVYSVNQATQMYVGTPTKVAVDSGKQSESVHYKIGNKTTQSIKKSQILYITTKKVAELATKAPVSTITVGSIEAGDEYIVRLFIEDDFGTANASIKTVGVLAKTSDAKDLAADIAKALTTAGKRDLEVDYTAAVIDDEDDTKVVITPINHWTLGKRNVTPKIRVEVTCIKGKNEGLALTEDWISVAYTAIAGTALNNLKDYEWFCAGERGDQYRGVSYPNDIPFVSELPAAITDQYYISTIHYYEDCSNEAVQKSEKTIVIVSQTSPTL